MSKIVFKCGVDMPTVQYKSTVKFINKAGVEKVAHNKFVIYDYFLDNFYLSHPGFVARGEHSYLKKEAYQIAVDRSKPKIKEAYKLNKGMKEILDVNIEAIYYYSSGYDFYGELNDDGYKFYFDQMELSKVKVDEDTKEDSIERFASIVRKFYTIKEFENAIRSVGKFKYTFKYNEFYVEPEKYIDPSFLLDNEELCLCRDYYFALHNPLLKLILCNNNLMCFSECQSTFDNEIVSDIYPENRFNKEIIYIDNNRLFSLLPCEMSSYVSIYSEEMDLPFLIKKEIIGDEKYELIYKLMSDEKVSENQSLLMILSNMI